MMSKRKTDIFVEQRPEWLKHRMVKVHIAPYLLPELLKIEGLNVADHRMFPDNPTCFISPLYGWDEIVREIENLAAPIPEAFMEEKE